MALALSSVSQCSVRPAAPRVQRRAVAARYSLKDAVDSVTDGFLKIFSKPTDNDVKWEGTANEFKGKIAHHGAGRPFKDGFQAGGQKYVDAKAEGEAQPEAQQAEAGAADYVGEAVQNLVAHNFTGDETEPPENTGSAGWKGDIHDRKREGFHARKV